MVKMKDLLPKGGIAKDVTAGTDSLSAHDRKALERAMAPLSSDDFDEGPKPLQGPAIDPHEDLGHTLVKDDGIGSSSNSVGNILGAIGAATIVTPVPKPGTSADTGAKPKDNTKEEGKSKQKPATSESEKEKSSGPAATVTISEEGRKKVQEAKQKSKENDVSGSSTASINEDDD